MKKVIVQRAARRVITEARDWYREENPELEEAFLSELDAVIGRIRELPSSHPIVDERDVRRALLNVFPFSVYYRVAGAVISIVAVRHQSRREPRFEVRR